ncbi:MAG: nuclease-related domain-containing DEAD/DEAH box helicase [Thermoleophilia bacterium]
MAQLIPPVTDQNNTSRGELFIFDLFKKSENSHGWTVFHSLDIADHVRQVQGEADFVVLIPGKGLLTIEVKGHDRISFKDGLWYFGGDAGKRRGPFKQSEEAARSIKEKLIARHPDLDGIVCWNAVTFPFANFNNSAIEWHDWQVIDFEDLNSRPFDRLVEGVLDRARDHLARSGTAMWFKPEAAIPDERQCKAVINTLSPSFEVFMSPKARTMQLEEELKRFTEDQVQALRSMERTDRIVFDGAAGTGKTVLAIEAARRGCRQGRKVLLLCYNRILSEWLKDQVACLAPLGRADTLHNYMCELTGLTPGAEPVGPEFWEQELPAKAIEKLLEPEDDALMFDELIIDEAQDILSPDYLDVLDLSLRGGLAEGRWRMFGDFEKQAIYGKGMSLEDLREKYGANWADYDLLVNSRNTPAIIDFAKRLSGIDLEYDEVRRSDSGDPAPEIIRFKDEEDQQAKLIEVLQRLEGEGFTGQNTVILSPRRDEASAAARISDKKWKNKLRPLREMDQNPNGPDAGYTGYCTIQAFKGMEAAAVVITDVADLESEKMRGLLYVGVTRALVRVVVLVGGE